MVHSDTMTTKDDGSSRLQQQKIMLAWSSSSRNLDDSDPRGRHGTTAKGRSSASHSNVPYSSQVPRPALQQQMMKEEEEEPFFPPDDGGRRIILSSIQDTKQPPRLLQQHRSASKKRLRDSFKPHTSSSDNMQLEENDDDDECSQPPLLKRQSASFYTESESHRSEFVRQLSGRSLSPVLPLDEDAEQVLRACSSSWVKRSSCKSLYPPTYLLSELLDDVEMDPSLLAIGGGQNFALEYRQDEEYDAAMEDDGAIPARASSPEVIMLYEDDEATPTVPANHRHPREVSVSPNIMEDFTLLVNIGESSSLESMQAVAFRPLSSEKSLGSSSTTSNSVRRVSLTGDSMSEEAEDDGGNDDDGKGEQVLASFAEQTVISTFSSSNNKASSTIVPIPTRPTGPAPNPSRNGFPAPMPQQSSIRGRGSFLPPSMTSSSLSSTANRVMVYDTPAPSAFAATRAPSASRNMSIGTSAPRPPFSAPQNHHRVDPNRSSSGEKSYKMKPREIDLSQPATVEEPKGLPRDLFSKILKSTARGNNNNAGAAKEIQFQAPPPPSTPPSNDQTDVLAHLERHEPPPFRSPGAVSRRKSAKQGSQRRGDRSTRRGGNGGGDIEVPASFSSSSGTSSSTGEIHLPGLSAKRSFKVRNSMNLDRTMHRTSESSPRSSIASSNPSMASRIKQQQQQHRNVSSRAPPSVNAPTLSLTSDPREIQFDATKSQSKKHHQPTDIVVEQRREVTAVRPPQRQSLEPLVRTPHKRGSDLFGQSRGRPNTLRSNDLQRHGAEIPWNGQALVSRKQQQQQQNSPGKEKRPSFAQARGMDLSSPPLKAIENKRHDDRASVDKDSSSCLPIWEVECRPDLEHQVSILSMSSLSNPQERIMNEKIFAGKKELDPVVDE